MKADKKTPPSSYNQTIQEVCGVDANTARMVEAYLRLQYSTLDSLTRYQMRFEYLNGGAHGSIKQAIELDRNGSMELAESFGL